MRGSSWLRPAGALALAMTLVTCSGGDQDPGGAVGAPRDLLAETVGMRTVRVSWAPATGTNVAGYEIQRRQDLQGEFTTIEANYPPSVGARIAYFDTKVEPNTYYGYRVRAVSSFGARSALTNIAGAKTSPAPGLLIRTSTVTPNPESADPDGYTALIRGAKDTTSIALAVNGERLVAIGRGTYSVVLRGMATNCAPTTSADTLKSATVTDEGTQTVASVSFVVSCRDPKKASIVVVHSTTGDTLDADGLALTMSGIIREAGTPADERVYFQSRKLEGRSGATRFDNLRLGDYEISIADVDPPCTLDGDRIKTLQPKALAVDTVRFGVTCRKPPVPVDTVGKPFVLRQKWSSPTARQGDKVSLVTSLDLHAQASQKALGVSATMQFDDAVVKYDSARTLSAFDITTVSRPQSNLVALAATNTSGEGVAGDIQVVRLWFTVVGAVGSSVRTSTSVTEVLDPALAKFNDKVRPEDATLTVSNVAPTNQAPTARITAPATGTTGTAVTFSGSTSSDPDGTIAAYAWTFGDNSTGSGASATHTYSSAGTYTVRLTVTDDKGATGFVEQPITITSSAPSTGTIQGTVTSALRGALAGVTVTVEGGGTATTNASGAYTITGVATGSKSVSLSTLPSGCTAPAAVTVTVNANATATQDFAVTCTGTATTGTITGKITRVPDNTPLAGVTVSVAPAGSNNPLTATTGADGTYSVANIPIGTGTTAGQGSITLSQIPTGCTNPGSQSYTGLTAGGTVTKDINVTCPATGGTVTGTITKNTGGPAAGVQVTLTPSSGNAPAAVTTNASGVYTVAAVPTGGGTIALATLPTGCTAPTGLTYTGVTVGGTVTKDIGLLTCTAGGGGGTGTVNGTITKSTGGNASGVGVALTPTGGSALPTVTTNASGVYSIPSVPVSTGGMLALSTLPAGCTPPADLSVGAIASGATVTKNLTLTCAAAGITYPVTATWGAITNTGPTGRQVTMTLAIDMGAAPGLPDVDGANADPLASITFLMTYDWAKIRYGKVKTALSANEFDLILANENETQPTNADCPLQNLCVSIASSQGMTKTGSFPLVRLTFNIAAGATGTVTPTITIKELQVTHTLIIKTSTGVVQPPPALTIP